MPLTNAEKSSSNVSDAVTSKRPLFTVCIPAYNRARCLRRLLDSIFSQDFNDFEILICEDDSAERPTIASIADEYKRLHPQQLRYLENERNVGYDNNIRNLVARSWGEFCFFMGNDDVMCLGALSNVADLIQRNPDVGLVLKSYTFSDAGHVAQEVRYFAEERRFSVGSEAITVCFRRSGVIAGYVIRRDPAHEAATTRYDGTLFYQMHLTASVLSKWPAVFTPKILVHCSGDEPPDFGNSPIEQGRYEPGIYTPQARLRMVGGALQIIRDLDANLAEHVQRDYANYFYPYIKDQLNAPLRTFFRLYWAYAQMGFYKYPIFHLYCVVAYILGERRFDLLTKAIRRRLGRSPQIGTLGR